MVNYLGTFRGTIHTGTLGEVFSHSVAIQSGNPALTVALDMGSAWQYTWNDPTNGLRQFFHAEVKYLETTAAPILSLTDGTLGAAVHQPFVPELVGQGVGTQLPSQTALAVSLKAGLRTNGTPLKGRFYLPAFMSGAITTDGTLGTTTQTKIKDAIDLFFDYMTSTGDYVCVWSRTMGVLQLVDSFRVGNKADTIRRRRNALPESYVTATVPGPAVARSKDSHKE